MKFTIYNLRFTPRSSRREEALTNPRLDHSMFDVARPIQPFPGPKALQRFIASGAATASPLQRSPAFTLVELLVVIAIIGILSAMLLVVISRVPGHAKRAQARLDVSQIATAVEEYNSTYGHMPVSEAVQRSGSNNVTYGGAYTSAATTGNRYPDPSVPGWHTSTFGYSTPEGLYITSNSDVMAILLDLPLYPNSTPTVNANHQRNPQQKPFLNLKLVGDTVSPGVGQDLNCRDPWGNPYLITMNLNDANNVEDPFYAPPSMSSSTGFDSGAGVDGLSFQSADDHYQFHGNVMVWSMGPGGPADRSPTSFTYSPVTTAPSGAWAQDPSNKHHILSWEQ
ncbi:MAG TPA: type II secretion system protein [Verrucomicrobiae bacterium]|nr:type II secretion system protein [Verrucomicrobiae bacterium]